VYLRSPKNLEENLYYRLFFFNCSGTYLQLYLLTNMFPHNCHLQLMRGPLQYMDYAHRIFSLCDKKLYNVRKLSQNLMEAGNSNMHYQL